MSNQRTHYVTTTDGVTIGGTVHGQGPALVFLQGAVGDGDLDWQRVLAHLTDQYTCHLPSLRGRGLSGDHPDLSPSRIVEDFATYTDSIGEPVGLVGWSGADDRLLRLVHQAQNPRLPWGHRVTTGGRGRGGPMGAGDSEPDGRGGEGGRRRRCHPYSRARSRRQPGGRDSRVPRPSPQRTGARRGRKRRGTPGGRPLAHETSQPAARGG